MKKNQMIGIVITVIAVVIVGLYFWQNNRQKALKPTNAKPIEDNRQQITDQNNPEYQSTVLINSTEKQSEFGTGYVVGKNTVMTNRHVVQDVKKTPNKAVVRVGHRGKDGKVNFVDFKIKEIVMPNEESMDVALLKLEPLKDGKTVSDYRKIAEFGDTSKVKVGTTLTVVGFPGDKKYATMWAGTGEVDMKSDNMISFRAITAPGNSGSPLFDDEGKVVAMNNAGGDNNSFGFLIDQEILKFVQQNVK